MRRSHRRARHVSAIRAAVSANPVERRPLGNTGQFVAVLGFGGMELRDADHPGARPVDADQADRLLNLAIDGGVDFIDTSPDYGRSEATIGRAVAARRDEVFLASKCGCPMHSPGVHPRDAEHDFTRANIAIVLERTLKRLQTDHVDLLQFHTSPARSVLERDGAIETLIELRNQGKIRFIGSSSTIPNVDDHLSMGVFDAVQVPYSALKPEHSDVIARAHRSGVGVIVRGGVARGEPAVGHGSAEVWSRWAALRLDELLDGESRTGFMLRFTITNPAIATTIVGTLSNDHLTQNLAAAQRGPLPTDTYVEAARRLGVAVSNQP